MRPTKLTRQVTAAICEAVRAGVQFEQACRSAGIAASTGFEWRARGEGRDPRRPATSLYREFAEAVARAEGAAWRDEVRAGFAECSEQRENSRATEFAEPGFIDTRDHARARGQEAGGEPGRRAPFVWRSKRSRTGAVTEGLIERDF